MILKDIRIYVDPESEGIKAPSAHCVLTHYRRNLGKVEITSFNYINIFFTDKASKHKSKKIDANFVDYYYFWQENEFLREERSKYSMKKSMLKKITYPLLCLCDEYGWNRKPFKDAYTKCLAENLNNEWYFKDKLFRSPNRELFFGLHHIYDTSDFKIYEVLFDKNKKEIARRLCFHDTHMVFYLESASWEGNNDCFFYKFNGPKKIFKSEVDDLRQERERYIPESTSDYFK